MQDYRNKKGQEKFPHIDIEALNASIRYLSAASHQATYVWTAGKRRDVSKRIVREIVNRPLTCFLIDEDNQLPEIVESLIEITFDYFQNTHKAVQGFVEFIQEFRVLSQVPALTPLFFHQRIDDIIDKQEQYSNFQEMIDEMEHYKEELMECLSKPVQDRYRDKIIHSICKLKNYYLFIESLTNVFSRELECSRFISQSNLFCFILRQDRAQPKCQEVYQTYLRELRKRVVSVQ